MIRTSPVFLSKMTAGLRQNKSKVVKWAGEGKNNFLWWETNCSWLFYRVPHHTLREVGHLRSDSWTAVAVGPQDELPIQTHNSIKSGYCSNYFVLAAVSMPAVITILEDILLLPSSFQLLIGWTVAQMEAHAATAAWCWDVFDSVQRSALWPSVNLD